MTSSSPVAKKSLISELQHAVKFKAAIVDESACKSELNRTRGLFVDTYPILVLFDTSATRLDSMMIHAVVVTDAFFPIVDLDEILQRRSHFALSEPARLPTSSIYYPERLIQTAEGGVFTPSGRLRRLKRWRVFSNRSSRIHPDTSK